MRNVRRTRCENLTSSPREDFQAAQRLPPSGLIFCMHAIDYKLDRDLPS